MNKKGEVHSPSHEHAVLHQNKMQNEHNQPHQ